VKTAETLQFLWKLKLPAALHLRHRAPSTANRVNGLLLAAERRSGILQDELVVSTARILLVEGALDGTEGLIGAEPIGPKPSEKKIRALKTSTKLFELAKNNILGENTHPELDHRLNNLEAIFDAIDTEWRTWERIAEALKGKDADAKEYAETCRLLRDASLHMLRERSLSRNKRLAKTTQAEIDQEYFGPKPAGTAKKAGKIAVALILAALALALGITTGLAQIGATSQECTELYGEPEFSARTGTNAITVLYTRGDSDIVITFFDDKAKRILFLNPVLSKELRGQENDNPWPQILTHAAPQEKHWKQVTDNQWEGKLTKATFQIYPVMMANFDKEKESQSWTVEAKQIP
jgi:hypothetical protein